MFQLPQSTLQSSLTIAQALVSIRGVGRKTAVIACKSCGILPSTPVKAIGIGQVNFILSWSEKNLAKQFFFGFALGKEVRKNKHKLARIGHYRGIRLVQGLPSRGQRTKTNGKMAKKLRGWLFFTVCHLLIILIWLS